MHRSKIAVRFLPLLFFLASAWGQYYSTIPSENIYLSEADIRFNDRTVSLKELGFIGYRKIIRTKEGFFIGAVKNICVLNHDLKFRNSIHYKDCIYLTEKCGNSVCVVSYGMTEFFDEKMNRTKMFRGRYEVLVEGDAVILKKSKREYYLVADGYLKKIEKNDPRSALAARAEKALIDNDIVKCYVFDGTLYGITVTGGLMREGERLPYSGVRSLEKRNGTLIACGEEIREYPGGDALITALPERKAFVHRVFDLKGRHVISSFDRGVIDADTFQAIDPYGLLAGVSGETLYMRSGLIRSPAGDTVTDEITGINGEYIFTRNAVLFKDLKEALRKENMYFSGFDLQRMVASSLKFGLFTVKGDKLEKISGFEKGVKEMFVHNERLYLIANDGLYSYEERGVKKIFSGAINSYTVKDGILYIGAYGAGVLRMKGGIFERTSLSFADANAFFTQSAIIMEIYRNIMICSYEDLK